MNPNHQTHLKLPYHFKFTCNNCGFTYECYSHNLPIGCTRHKCRSKDFKLEVYKGEQNEKAEI